MEFINISTVAATQNTGLGCIVVYCTIVLNCPVVCCILL